MLIGTPLTVRANGAARGQAEHQHVAPATWGARAAATPTGADSAARVDGDAGATLLDATDGRVEV